MAEQVRTPDLRAALESYLREESYRRSRREAGRPQEIEANRAYPLQFDESGFPIREQGESVVKRIGRLLNPF